MLLEIESQVSFKKDPQTLLKTSSTNVAQRSPHECYSKLVPQVLLEIDPQTLLEIDPQTLLKTDLYTLLRTDPQTLLKIDPQTLLKIGFTSVIQN